QPPTPVTLTTRAMTRAEPTPTAHPSAGVGAADEVVASVVLAAKAATATTRVTTNPMPTPRTATTLATRTAMAMAAPGAGAGAVARVAPVPQRTRLMTRCKAPRGCRPSVSAG